MSFVKLNLVLKTDRPTDQPKYRSDLPSLKKGGIVYLRLKCILIVSLIAIVTSTLLLWLRTYFHGRVGGWILQQ